MRAVAGTGRPFGSSPCVQGPLQAADVASAMYISMVNEVSMSRERTIDEVAAIRKGSKRRFNNRSGPPVRKAVKKPDESNTGHQIPCARKELLA